MDMKNSRKIALLALGAITVSVFSAMAWAQAPAVDPAAVHTLQKMTVYMAGLEKFSVHTQNTLEETFDTGQRIDIDMSANIVVRRPDKLHAERVGEVAEQQSFYYDGQTLTMHVRTRADTVYATMPAPGTIEELIDFSRENLGIILPVSDLVYRNAQSILMDGVTSAMVVGEARIGEMTCSHLAFRRPDVDFQVWVSTGDLPLPCKYVVTDISTPAMVSIVTVMSDWNPAPAAPDSEFQYMPPENAKPVEFLPLESGSDR